MTIKHYEVQTLTVADGWTNTWHNEEEPQVFATEHGARKALSEFFDDLPEEMRGKYDRADYRIEAIRWDELLVIDEGATPEQMARGLQAAISTIELRDLIDELAELYEPTEDMEQAEDTEAYESRLYPRCFESRVDQIEFDQAGFERGRREGYFDSTTGAIETDNGIQLAPRVARELFKDGRFSDFNISFSRLANEFDFDVKACLNWYTEQDLLEAAKVQLERNPKGTVPALCYAIGRADSKS